MDTGGQLVLLPGGPHAFASHALLIHTHLWIKWVPSSENIADLPSRVEYKLLGLLDAEWIEPWVAQLFVDWGAELRRVQQPPPTTPLG